MWGATARHEVTTQSHEVSIHAPRVGCDPRWESSRREPRCFNSRTPCGVRQLTDDQKAELTSFNSRTPCGVRHLVSAYQQHLDEFQFTHPVWGATTMRGHISAYPVSFNSRTPCGVRLKRLLKVMILLRFQFTHPVWGATQPQARAGEARRVSIHAPRVGCD